jgi:polysaccharide biosynthesis/export protein ExoF
MNSEIHLMRHALRTRRKGAALVTRPGLFPLLAAVASLLWSGSAVAAEPYRLVAQDRIALRVVEWRSGEGEFRDWTVLNGTYLIGDDGSLAPPMVGAIDAKGLTTRELGDTITARLRTVVGETGLFAAVEVAQYGPIYITGAVATPGQYPFSPDLTIMKAISLAGGLQREAENSRGRLERDRIQAAGLYGTARLEYYGLLMREARLRAEKSGKENFDIPASLAGFGGAAALQSEELELMRLRRVETGSKLDSAKGLGLLYSGEIGTLQSKITTQERQSAVVQNELKTVSSLLDRGLVQSSRRLALEREETEGESRILDFQFQLLRARQSLEENKRNGEEIVNTKNSEIQTELNEVIRQISEADLKARTAELLLGETDSRIQDFLLDEQLNNERKVTFYVTRKEVDGGTTRITATSDTPIEPRDLIEVNIEGPARLPISMGGVASVTNEAQP